jgi:hypothetical protein
MTRSPIFFAVLFYLCNKLLLLKANKFSFLNRKKIALKEFNVRSEAYKCETPKELDFEIFKIH